jgi:superfamily I DNA and/or RNA helicase
MKFLTAGEIDISEIGILTPYLSQRNLLKKAMQLAREVNIPSQSQSFSNLLKKYPSIFSVNGTPIDETIMVEHMDTEKSIDKELIIISTVRSNEDVSLYLFKYSSDCFRIISEC